MAIDVRIQGKATIPGVGFTTAGVPKNSKVFVWGDVDITTYTAQGEPVTPADLGLRTIDAVFLSVRDVDDTLPTATNIHVATYDYSAQQILAWDGATGSTVPGASAQLKFLAIGDSGFTADLT